MNRYNINPNKINILTIGNLQNGYSFTDVKTDIAEHIYKVFGISEEYINIYGSNKMPTNGNKYQAMEDASFDILIVGKNAIYRDRGGAKSLINGLAELGFVGTCTRIKGSYKYKKLEPINRSNLKRAIGEAMEKFLGYDVKSENLEEDFQEYIY